MPPLRTLPALARIGLSGLMLVLLIGMFASLAHMYFHDRNRDESPELSLDDIRATYHGLDRPAPLLTTLERGHPETLKKELRETLLKWLKSGRIAEDHDSIDLGPASPSEIIASNCISCHSAKGTDPRATAIRLDALDSLSKLAYPKRINPTPVNVVAMSTHAHALSLATMSIVLLGLLWLTRLPRGMVSVLAALNGLGLLADIGSWWLARSNDAWVYAIVTGGGVYNATAALIAVAVLVDLWWPRRTP